MGSCPFRLMATKPKVKLRQGTINPKERRGEAEAIARIRVHRASSPSQEAYPTLPVTRHDRTTLHASPGGPATHEQPEDTTI